MILRHHLGVWKRCARWIPHQLTEEQRRARKQGSFTYFENFETKQQFSVRPFPGEKPPVEIQEIENRFKQMIAVFFAKSGHVASFPIQERKTVNAEWYTNICLPKVFEAWSARRPNNGTRSRLLHHDNASAHTAVATLDYPEADRVQLVTQTPYSSGLASCVFFPAPSHK